MAAKRQLPPYVEGGGRQRRVVAALGLERNDVAETGGKRGGPGPAGDDDLCGFYQGCVAEACLNAAVRWRHEDDISAPDFAASRVESIGKRECKLIRIGNRLPAG